jgi:hypothetical protein
MPLDDVLLFGFEWVLMITSMELLFVTWMLATRGCQHQK